MYPGTAKTLNVDDFHWVCLEHQVEAFHQEIELASKKTGLACKAEAGAGAEPSCWVSFGNCCC